MIIANIFAWCLVIGINLWSLYNKPEPAPIILDKTLYFNSFESDPVEEEEIILLPDEKTWRGENGLPIILDIGIEYNLKYHGILFADKYIYKYYSSAVLPHKDIDEWYLCDDGIYRTVDEYIVVASGTLPLGTIVETPFGLGIVLDECNPAYDYTTGKPIIDIYVNW